MDQVRVVAGVLEFGLLARAHTRWVPSAHREQLTDALLTLRGQLSAAEAAASGCHDVRVWIDDHDVTTIALERLRVQLDGPRTEQFRAEYVEGMRRWLDFAEVLGVVYPAPDLAAERARAAQLGTAQPLSSVLDRLGDQGAGWSGTLHIFHYLYSHVRVAPLSFSDLVRRWNVAHRDRVIDLATVSAVTISSGPLAGPDVAPGRGAVAMQLEFIHHNTLEDRVALLEQRFDQFEANVLDRLDEIAESLGGDGPIQRYLGTTTSDLAVLRTQLASTQQAQAGHERQLDALATTAHELKLAVERVS